MVGDVGNDLLGSDIGNGFLYIEIKVAVFLYVEIKFAGCRLRLNSDASQRSKHFTWLIGSGLYGWTVFVGKGGAIDCNLRRQRQYTLCCLTFTCDYVQSLDDPLQFLSCPLLPPSHSAAPPSHQSTTQPLAITVLVY